jgi:inositol hexakisphosphate/diphosphoinositol-pentakisphosphate kinase
MKENEIPVNDYLIVDRETHPDVDFDETKESVIWNGSMMEKPFVEKPFDADDHNIYVYYGPKEGFGSTRLHRKT